MASTLCLRLPRRFLARLACGLLLVAAQRSAPAGDAQTVAALEEMRVLAEAEDFARLDTTFFIGLEDLNDIAVDTPGGHDFDFINDEGGTFAILPNEGRFRTTRLDLLARPESLQYEGPYINYQTGRIQLGTEPYDQGSPLDPWGTPYFLFTPRGLARADRGTVTLELYGDLFDRYAIVSFGPDGVLSDDDLVRLFGGGITTVTITSLAGVGVETNLNGTSQQAPVDSLLTIRGYNLGSEQGESQVLFNGEPTGTIESWSTTQVGVRFPAGLSELTGSLQVRRNQFLLTNSLAVSFFTPFNAAAAWPIYE